MIPYFPLMQLFFALCSTFARPSASMTGGRQLPDLLRMNLPCRLDAPNKSVLPRSPHGVELSHLGPD
jgi:hypothetical protein